MTSKKIRSGRVSDQQLVAMVDFFENNKGMAQGKFSSVNGKDVYNTKWSELAEELNRIRGGQKTVAQWQTTWRDLKSRTSIKVKNIRNERTATGNREINETKLTPLDLRIVGLIGAEYVEGSAVCPDSIPEEEDLLERLMAGDCSVVDISPTSDIVMRYRRINSSSDKSNGSCTFLKSRISILRSICLIRASRFNSSHAMKPSAIL